MTPHELLKYMDHTQLKAVSTWADIQKLCEEAVRYQTASVCIPPSYVRRVKDTYGDRLTICTVIGFPLGYHTTAVKVFETEQAVRDGADEIDMVINLGDVKNNEYKKVTEEIRRIKEAAGGRILKVIIETCYLSAEEKISLCRCVTEAGADFIKTSTGFGTAGASLEDIRLFREHLGASVRIKAAGGIRTPEEAQAYIQAGCARIGSSAAGQWKLED